MLGALEARTGRLVVADLEAGVGTVARLGGSEVDRLVLVIEPSAKSMEVGRRALKIGREVGIPDVLVVASRVVDGGDLEWVAERMPDAPVLGVPDDPAVLDADRVGAAPIDHAPDSPAVQAIGRLADALLDGDRRK